jgi:DNA mismatch repair protein MutL
LFTYSCGAIISPMAKIRVLDEVLINKIAAGEVVERPAAALKELLENSLDAGARELLVDLEGGGARLIRVTDDGEGMAGDDMLLALERHATSKIHSMEDLEAVGSLGFRGEALPAVAAVSRLTLRSRPRGAAEGREVTVEGGVVKGVRPAAMAEGTVVEVRSLFYNVPARRKFLRTSQTEFGHCYNVVNQYALAFPECTLRLRHDGAEQINAVPTESLRDRVAHLLGADLLRRLVAAEGRDGQVGLVGFVSEPSLHRSDTSMLHFFVNRRAVRDKVLFNALRTAYEDLLPKRRSPVAFLFLELPARSVDVNVHPAKTEIRFRNPSQVHELVVRTVRRALAIEKPLTPLTPAPGPGRERAGARAGTLESLDKALKKGERTRPERIDFRGLREFFPPRDGPQVRTQPQTPQEKLTPAKPFSPSDAETQLDRTTPAPESEVRAEPDSTPPERFRAREIDPDSLILLGQVRSSYIVAAFEGGLLIIDQHAAHERVLFESLQKNLAGVPDAQRLLHPLVIHLTPAHARALESRAEALAELGFEVEPFGPGSVALRCLPAALAAEEAEEIIAGMAADLERLGGVDATRLHRELILSASCHGAIKVNTPLGREKMRRLLDDLFACEMPMRCPHGRPVVLTIGEEELRKRFGRS